jgi:hypothetical protein
MFKNKIHCKLKTILFKKHYSSIFYSFQRLLISFIEKISFKTKNMKNQIFLIKFRKFLENFDHPLLIDRGF